MKLEEIRKGYEETSGVFSSTARQISISGIAIAWLFMTTNVAGGSSVLLLMAMALFVLTLFMDLIQNFSLSIIWYFYYKNRREKGINEDDEVNEPESYNTLAWILYVVKFFTLIGGYILIVCHYFKA